jgi:lysophospholipase L1-like esterase
MRRFSHVIAFDDCAFDQAERGDVGLVGAVFAGQRLDGVLSGRVRRDGANSSAVMAKMIYESRFVQHLQLIMLQGIAVAGFNVVDVFELQAATDLPILVVARREPDLAAIQKTLSRRFWVFSAGLAVNAIVLAACAGPATPTQVPHSVPPAADPPKITCPAAQTAQSLDGGATNVTFTAPTAVNGQPPMTTTCTPPAGSAFSVGQTTVTCTVTDALQRTATCLFPVTVLNPPKLATTSFLSFGDSITYGEDGQNSVSSSVSIMSSRFHPSVQFPLAQQYPQELQQSLVDRYKTQLPTVKNEGQRGEAAGDPAALVRFMGLTSKRQYSVILIMEGSNDIFYGDASQEPFAINGLRQMIRNAKGLNIRPYLATIPPMNPTACNPVCRGRAGWSLVSGFNDNVRTLAKTEGVDLVDVYFGFGGNLALIGPDGLHPAAEGYAKIADLFFTAIKQTLETSSTSGVLNLHRATSAAR